MTWDSAAAAHLSLLTTRVREAGVIDYVHTVTSELWYANVDRHDPEALFDDNRTLGFSASANVANRLFAELRAPSGQLLPAASSVRDKQSTVILVGDIQVRIVKAPVARGRRPHFTQDFSWEDREGRLAPAARNALHYEALAVHENHEPMFEIPVPDAAVRVALCRDIFVIWGGDLDGKTAGWMGLPTTGPKAFLAVEPIWFDEDFAGGARGDAPIGPLDGKTFTQIEPPQPRLTLKPRADEGTNNG